MEITTLEPLSLEELEAVAGHLDREKWLEPDDRQAFIESLETTAIVRSQEAWRAITQSNIALFLIRHYGLHMGRKNELGLPMETWEQYLAYMRRRGLTRSTSFKHLASLLIFHKGLGRDVFGALLIPGGVQSLDGLKTMVDYNVKTGEILGPKNPQVLERLPCPEENLVTRINMVLDGVAKTGPDELQLTPREVSRLLHYDYGGKSQISFFWTLGPFGEALGWYYSLDGLEASRGIVSVDPMPPVVAHKLGQWARVTERDPTPFAEQLLKEDKMYHQVTICGYLGKDPEMRYTPAGRAVTNFSVATSRKWTNADGTPGEETVWFKITAWQKLAEICNQYLSKGRPVLITGRMNPNEYGGPRIWETRDGDPRADYEVVANQVRFLGRGTAQEEPVVGEPPVLDDKELEPPF